MSRIDSDIALSEPAPLEQRVAPPEKKSASPRYRDLVDELTSAIAEGRYPVGSTLPTEHTLCERFDVSRFTVREAMRRLHEAGLVTRRPRAGTVVIAKMARRRYLQTLNSLEDIRQYAQDTILRVIYLGKVEVDASLSRDIPIKQGEQWYGGLAIRLQSDTGLPLCVSRIYVNPAFSGIPKWIRRGADAIYKILEQNYGIVVARVDQSIHAVRISREDAPHLKTRPNSMALRNIRLYYDSDDRLIEATDNIHPADRFSYAMSIRKFP